MKQKQREVRKTLLAVGEGDTDEAFLNHLRSLYCSGGAGVRVTVRNAHGGDPENIVNTARQDPGGYDQRIVLLDTDIPWPKNLQNEAARDDNIEMIGSHPCHEGLLLSILGKNPPNRSEGCKKMIQKKLPGIDLTEKQNYARNFPKLVLDDARTRISELNKLLKFFEGLGFPNRSRGSKSGGRIPLASSAETFTQPPHPQPP
ncbi:RloB domain-containing protein [Verminephrobacter aporrectodeae]|uniref:RloB domain-containing protein n=1 Tax=Verminephrobacter aporrectodeae TaxID=1110389 RepID=UPI002244A3B6|nr:RloB domain-containing protein [Verminephrobacter aporrectodeae]